MYLLSAELNLEVFFYKIRTLVRKWCLPVVRGVKKVRIAFLKDRGQ